MLTLENLVSELQVQQVELIVGGASGSTSRSGSVSKKSKTMRSRGGSRNGNHGNNGNHGRGNGRR